MQSIVVAYDATDASRRALDRAGELAQAFGAQLTVTSVAPVLASPRSGAADPTDPPEAHQRQLHEAQAHLAERGVHAQTAVTVGHPEEAIVQVALDVQADLIVVGSRGVGLLGRLLGQSVSEGVAHRAPCDVYLVRDED